MICTLAPVCDSYVVGWIADYKFEVVAAYVQKTLAGVSPDRIVSITHAMAAPQLTAIVTAPWSCSRVPRQRAAPNTQSRA
jgi:hypothetical protein